MELFTLGITGPDGTPNYTEQDVREAARAFTGWGLDRQGRYAFNAAQHDPGPKTIFGKIGNFNGDDVIDLIMAHPSSAPYICRRLFAFFAYDDPEPDALAPIVDAFTRNGHSIREAVRAILTSPAFYSEKAYRAKVKSPVEFVVGVARAVQVETDAFGFNMSAGRMGQVLFYPPNVAGWPGGLHWFNTSAWLARLNHVGQLAANRQDTHTRPLKLAPIVQRFGLYTPDKMVDFLLDLLVDSQVTPDQRQVLLHYATDGLQWPDPPQPTKGTTGAKGTAAPADASPTLDESHPIVDRKFRGLLYLILSSPEYQLA